MSVVVKGNLLDRAPPAPKDKLSYEEYTLVKKIFLNVIESQLSMPIGEGDQNEIAVHLGRVQGSFDLFRFAHPKAVDHFTNQTFTTSVLQEFHMELLERFSLEICAIGENVFERLVNTLVEASVSCKAQVQPNRLDGLSPMLTQIAVTREDLTALYKTNPWLVTNVLLHTQFSSTSIAKFIPKTQ